MLLSQEISLALDRSEQLLLEQIVEDMCFAVN
jgi:hypothetical protein